MKTCIECKHVGANGLGHRICVCPRPAWLNGKMSPHLASEENVCRPYAQYSLGLESINIAERCVMFEQRTPESRVEFEARLKEVREKEISHCKQFHPTIDIEKQY